MRAKHIQTTLKTAYDHSHQEFVLKAIDPALEAVDDKMAAYEADGRSRHVNDPLFHQGFNVGFPVVTYSVASENMNVEDLSCFVDDTVTKRLSDYPRGHRDRQTTMVWQLRLPLLPRTLLLMGGLKLFYHSVIQSNHWVFSKTAQAVKQK